MMCRCGSCLNFWKRQTLFNTLELHQYTLHINKHRLLSHLLSKSESSHNAATQHSWKMYVQLMVTSKTQRWLLDLHERSSLFKNHLHTKHIAHQPTRRSLKKQQKKLYCSWPNKNTWDVTTLSSPNLSQKKTSKHRMLVSRKQKRLFLFVFLNTVHFLKNK